MAEWECRCLGDVAELKMGQSPAGHLVKPLGDGLPFLQGNAEFGSHFPTAVFQCDEAPRRSAPGDSLISVRAPVGAINRSDLEYGIGRGLAAVAFETIDPGFGHHALAEHARSLHRVAQGTTFSAIGRTKLAELRFPVPPLEEQRQITEVLDTIDETIQATEGIIAKLRQQGQGLEVCILYESQDARQLQLMEVANVDRGKFTARPRNDPIFYGGKYPFIQTGDVAGAQRSTGIGYSQTLNDLGLSVSRIFHAGTIAVTIAANIADTAILDQPMCFPDSVVGVVVSRPNSARWVELCIHASKRILDARAPQSAQKNINLQDLRQLVIPVPDPARQHVLAESWEDHQRSLDQEVHYLVKLKRLRWALASDLLSGRVRTVAA